MAPLELTHHLLFSLVACAVAACGDGGSGKGPESPSAGGSSVVGEAAGTAGVSVELAGSAGTSPANGGAGAGGRSSAGSGGTAGQSGGSGGSPSLGGAPPVVMVTCEVTNHPSVTEGVACVGDSITFGLNASAPERSYPSQLKDMLGAGYDVHNYGVSGSGAIKTPPGDSYWKHHELTDAENLAPKIAIIALGTNDIGTYNWTDPASFASDYTDLVNTFKKLSSQPRVYAVLPPWLKGSNGLQGYSDERLTTLVIPQIMAVAKATGACLINLHDLTLNHPEWYSDEIHPNDTGYGQIANAVCNAIVAGCPPTQP